MSSRKENLKSPRESTVSSYSDKGAMAYEDPMNKNFLYGKITVDFLKQIEFRPHDKVCLDMGCGTGFVFDVLSEEFSARGMKGIGVEPATGMMDIARAKYKDNKAFVFHEGSFEGIPLGDNSVDRIVSTLALHWVKALEVAAEEMHRVLKSSGAVDILMIARDDGYNFKKGIVAAQRKHLTFKQIMQTANLVQRVNETQLEKAFDVFSTGFDIQVQKFKKIVYGSFDEHMKWWKARSSPVIAEVKDRESFMLDLRGELEKMDTGKGIPFDTEYLWITLKNK
jgi:ubiquinone/menaquinone biosynthesis C-methylase UbiE